MMGLRDEEIASSLDLIPSSPYPIVSSSLESSVMRKINLEPFAAATQTYPRKQDWLVMNALAGRGAIALQICV